MKKEIDIRVISVTPFPAQSKVALKWLDEKPDALIIVTYATGAFPMTGDSSFFACN